MTRITITDHYMTGPGMIVEEVSRSVYEEALANTDEEFIKRDGEYVMIVVEEAYEIYDITSEEVDV